jgi:hypothetical protein
MGPDESTANQEPPHQTATLPGSLRYVKHRRLVLKTHPFLFRDTIMRLLQTEALQFKELVEDHA